MLTIGLTGGIASGKTTATEIFKQLSVTIIDSDIISREVVTPNLPAWQSLKNHFGPEILHQDHTLNRALLREIIFAEPQEKEWLENLLHPLIRQEMAKQLANITSDYAIVAIPLLVESEPNPLLNRILLIDAPADLQLERLIQRDSCTVAQGLAMIAAQASREQRLEAADDVIENIGTEDELRQAILKQHESYLTLAQSK